MGFTQFSIMMEQIDRQNESKEPPKPKDEDKLFTDDFMLCADCKRELALKKIDFTQQSLTEMRTKAEVDRLIAQGQFPRLSNLICLTCESLCCRNCFLKHHRGDESQES